MAIIMKMKCLKKLPGRAQFKQSREILSRTI